MQKWWIAVTITLLIGIRLLDPYPIEVMRLKGFDWLQRSAEIVHVDEVVLIDIGERSLAERGQWPWPRTELWALIRELKAQGAAVIGLNMMFPEPDRFGGDQHLASALDQVVIGQTASARGIDGAAPHVGTAVIGGNAADHLFTYPGVTRNLPIFEHAAGGAGMMSSAPELDGVLRRLPLAVAVGGKVYPSFALELLRVVTGQQSYQIKVDAAGIAAMRIPGFAPFQTDGNGRIWLRWNKQPERIEAIDDLSGVKDKMVIVGVTADGVSPLIPTPTGLQDAHEITSSNVIALLRTDGLVRLSTADTYEVMALLALLIVLVVLTARLPIRATIPSFVALGVGVGGGSWYAFQNGYLIDASYPLFGSLVTFSHALFNNFWREFHLRQQIKRQFEHYLDPRQVKRLQTSPELLQLGGEKRRATYLFTDVRGFTSLSESLEPPQVVEIMNEVLTIQADCVKRYGGMVDKFIGDAMMAVFNVPLDQPNHEDAAIVCAVEMQAQMAQLRERMQAEGRPDIAIGIGVNTGEATVGNLGSSTRFDFTCIGDAVNIAARMESATKEAGVDILIGAPTADAANIGLVELKKMRMKGKAKPVRVFTVPLRPGL